MPVVGLAATTLNVVVATLIGGTSGFLGGKLDLAVQRFVDAWMAFPGLLLLLTIMSVAGQDLLQIIVVLGVAGGVGGSRVVRGAVVATKGNDYFLAAKAVGAPTGEQEASATHPLRLPSRDVPQVGLGPDVWRSIAPPLAFFGFAAPPCRPVRVRPTGNPRVTLGRVRSEIQRRCGVRVRTQKAVAWSDRAGRWAVLGCRVSSSSMASSAVQIPTESGDGARQPAVPTDREHGEKSEKSCAYPLTRFSVPISARHGPWRPRRLSENDSASVDAAARR